MVQNSNWLLFLLFLCFYLRAADLSPGLEIGLEALAKATASSFSALVFFFLDTFICESNPAIRSSTVVLAFLMFSNSNSSSSSYSAYSLSLYSFISFSISSAISISGVLTIVSYLDFFEFLLIAFLKLPIEAKPSPAILCDLKSRIFGFGY